MSEAAAGVLIRPYRDGDRTKLVRLQKTQFGQWGSGTEHLRPTDPGNPFRIAAIVAQKPAGQLVAAFGAFHQCEIVVAIDRGRYGAREWLNIFRLLFVKMAAALFRQGFELVYARVSPSRKRLANLLVKRFGFVLEADAHLTRSWEPHATQNERKIR